MPTLVVSSLLLTVCFTFVCLVCVCVCVFEIVLLDGKLREPCASSWLLRPLKQRCNLPKLQFRVLTIVNYSQLNEG